MIIQYFLKWVETAPVSARAAAANALARAYIRSELSFEDRCGAEAALTMLLDDPSPKVRAALADALSMSPRAPIQIVSALAADQPEVAGPVLVRSPLLGDGELIDRVATGNAAIQRLVACRARIPMQLSAAIAEVGCAEACMELIANSGAEIAALSFRRMAERFGEDAVVRGALLSDPRLPVDVRHMLVVMLSQALRELPLVMASIGDKRAERVVSEACCRASLSLIERTDEAEHRALIEHLRLRGELTTAFLVHVVAHGRLDFFGAVLETLTGRKPARIRSLIASGGDFALSALLSSAGLKENFIRVALTAIRDWRQVHAGRRVAGTQEISWAMLRELEAAPGQAGAAAGDRELADLIKAIHVDQLRANARSHGLAIAAA
jgi:uncharacterized protein (DUF2336 family)